MKGNQPVSWETELKQQIEQRFRISIISILTKIRVNTVLETCGWEEDPESKQEFGCFFLM